MRLEYLRAFSYGLGPTAVLVALLGTLAVSCGSSGDHRELGAATATVEAVVFEGPAEGFEIEYLRLSGECARLNGLEYWNDAMSATGQNTESASHQGHPSGLTGRELVVQIGSGLTEAYIDYSASHPEGDSVGRVDNGLAEGEFEVTEEQFASQLGLEVFEYEVLLKGPVNTPNDGSFQGGCRDWAYDQARQLLELDQLDEIREDYARELSQWIETSSEMAAIEAEWSNCMAAGGFLGLIKQGDHIAEIQERLVLLEAGSLSESAALTYDKDITLRAWDCSETLNPERFALRDQFASDFAERYGLLE